MPKIRECLYEEKTQHGRLRYRFIRERGAPKIGIKGQPFEDEFERRYEFLLNGGDAAYVSKRSAKERKSPHRVGTYAELVDQYIRHMDQEQTKEKIASGTRTTYAGILRKTAQAIGDVHVASMDEVAVVQVLDALTSTPPTYNNMRKAMRRMFGFAKRNLKIISENPTDGIEQIDYMTDGFKEWSAEQIQQFLNVHQIGSTAHLALMLYVTTACRRSDVVKLGPDNIIDDGDRQFLEFTPTKGRGSKTPKVTIPIEPYLAAVLEQSKTGHDTFLQTEYGKPFSAKGFGNRMRKWIDDAGLPSNLSSHGVRKTIGTVLAEAGCSTYQIMAIHGHTDPKSSEIYTRQAKRKNLAKQGFARADIGKALGLKS